MRPSKNGHRPMFPANRSPGRAGGGRHTRGTAYGAADLWVRPEYELSPNSEANVFAKEEDSPDPRGNVSMADQDQSTTDLKIALVEQRLETKLVSIDAKLDRLFDSLSYVGEQAKEAKEAAQEARTAATNVKWNIAFAALGTVAILLAMWGIWAQGVEMVAGLLGPE